MTETAGIVPAGTPRRTVEPDPIAALMGKLRAMEERIARMERGAPLRNASISGGSGLTIYDGGGIAIKDGGTLNIDGTTTLNGPTKITGKTDINGVTTINGPAKITGTLELPAGIIGNDALAAPLNTGSSGKSETGFSVDVTHRKRAVSTLAVPSGFTKATILTIATATGVNTSAGLDYFSLQAYAGSGTGGESRVPAQANQTVNVSASAINTFNGLNGGSIEVGCYVFSLNNTWSANASNIASVNSIVWFTR